MCCSTPFHLPTIGCIGAISEEKNVDEVASTPEGSWKRSAAGLLKQDCSVTIHYCQMVFSTGVWTARIAMNIKGLEFYRQNHSLSHYNLIRLVEVVGIGAWVVRRFDNTCKKI